jgi:hypothetical protein
MANYKDLADAWQEHQRIKRQYYLDCKRLLQLFADDIRTVTAAPVLNFVRWDTSAKHPPSDSLAAVLGVTDRGWYGVFLELYFQGDSSTKPGRVRIPVEATVLDGEASLDIGGISSCTTSWPVDDEGRAKIRALAAAATDALSAELRRSLAALLRSVGRPPSRKIGFSIDGISPIDPESPDDSA